MRVSPGVWVVIGLLIAANALYVAAEFGAVGVRRSRVRRMSDDGNLLAKRLLPYVETPAALDRYVGASQIGITLSSLMLGAYAQAFVTIPVAPLVAQWFGLSATAALTTTTVVVLVALTSVQVIIGELVPKALALQYPTEIALATVLPMELSLRIYRPFLALLNGAASLALRLVGAGDQGHRHLHSPEEIDLLISESRDGGLLEPEEQQRLRRALRLGLRTSRDLMVPLDRITMLRLDAPWDEVVRTVAASPYSRLPVYNGAPEVVVGILRVKDLVDRYVVEGPLPLDRLMRPVVFVQDSLAADRVVTQLREKRVHSAIVTGAAGRAVGLITIQDVLGELLGTRNATPAGAGASA